MQAFQRAPDWLPVVLRTQVGGGLIQIERGDGDGETKSAGVRGNGSEAPGTRAPARLSSATASALPTTTAGSRGVACGCLPGEDRTLRRNVDLLVDVLQLGDDREVMMAPATTTSSTSRRAPPTSARRRSPPSSRRPRALQVSPERCPLVGTSHERSARVRTPREARRLRHPRSGFVAPSDR